MKIFKFILFIAIISGIAGLGSCKKDKSTKPTKANINNYLFYNSGLGNAGAVMGDGTTIYAGVDMAIFNVKYAISSNNGTFNHTFKSKKLSKQYILGTAAVGNFFYISYGGYSSTMGRYVLVLIKVDKQGNEIWSKEFGNPSETRYNAELIATKDGNLLLSGYVFDNSSNRLIMAIKVNENGEELWTQKVPAYTHYNIIEILEKSNEDFVFLSKDISTHELVITEINKNGNLNKVVGTKFVDDINSATLSFDQTSIIGVGSTPEGDVLLSKFDLDYNLIWQKPVGKEGIKEKGNDITACADGGFFITGNATGSSMNEGFFLFMKVNTSGEGLVYKAFGQDHKDIGNQILNYPNKGILMAGISSFMEDGAFHTGLSSVLLDENGNFK